MIKCGGTEESHAYLVTVIRVRFFIVPTGKIVGTPQNDIQCVSIKLSEDPKRLVLKKIILGITGASGAIYAIRTLRGLFIANCEIEMIISDYGKSVLFEEMGSKDPLEILKNAYNFNFSKDKVRLYSNNDMHCNFSSGSNKYDGMVVVPCSMKTLSGIARGAETNLIERSADVTLKESRTLVLVPRETPLNIIQIENVLKIAQAGAKILPAMPAFYYHPKTLEDIADFIAGRILNLFGIEHNLFEPWKK
jgi:4-hydroxy-3-polyprenylbenzoate decarboxylase